MRNSPPGWCRRRQAGLKARPVPLISPWLMSLPAPGCWSPPTAANRGEVPFFPGRAGLRLGIDTFMESYPQWDQQFFPTLLRCEKTHFWGYLMSPPGRILALASPDPVASWSLSYNYSMYGSERHFGHRIYTPNLDLLNALPLPERHPQNQDGLAPGEERSWRILLFPVATLDELQPALAERCGLPMVAFDRYTLAPGEKARASVWGQEPVTVQVIEPVEQQLQLKPAGARAMAGQLPANGRKVCIPCALPRPMEKQRRPGCTCANPGRGTSSKRGLRRYACRRKAPPTWKAGWVVSRATWRAATSPTRSWMLLRRPTSAKSCR